MVRQLGDGTKVPYKAQRKIGQPAMENLTQDRDGNSDNMFNDFFKSRARKGREYSRWIDLTLGIHFKAVIPESGRTQIQFR